LSACGEEKRVDILCWIVVFLVTVIDVAGGIFEDVWN
jgi:hypothetical protein